MPRLPALALCAFSVVGFACGGASEPDDVRVIVRTVALDPQAGSPVVLLEEQGGGRRLPIWIGFAEARSIAAEMEDEPRSRPNTHDLAKRLIEELAAKVERVVVTALRDQTFYALLVLHSSEGTIEIDCRPSDAIAIALRFGAPVYVRATVFDDSEHATDAPEVEQHI